MEELEYYLSSFKTLIPRLDLNKQIYVEGSTVGQVIFHCLQSANFWIRVIILRKDFERNRDLEYKEQPTLEQIQKSLDQALEACQMLKKANPDFTKKLDKPLKIMPVNFEAKINLDALAHAIAHTSEHYGELFQTTR